MLPNKRQDMNPVVAQIETLVKDAIIAYNDSELERFDSVLRYSKLLSIIDNADPSIANNITKLMIHHPHSPVYGVSKQYVLNLINPIANDSKNPVFYTTGFYVPAGYDVNGNTQTLVDIKLNNNILDITSENNICLQDNIIILLKNDYSAYTVFNKIIIAKII